MTKYLTIEEILVIHDFVIKEFGGSRGIRDRSALESAAHRPQAGYYSDIAEQATALMESLANNHPFIDGNKRVAFFATDIFLRLNQHYIECDSEFAYQFLNGLFETNKFKFANLLPWLRQHIKAMQR